MTQRLRVRPWLNLRRWQTRHVTAVYYGEKVHLRRAIEDLRGQLADYEKGQGKRNQPHASSMKYTPRKTGKLRSAIQFAARPGVRVGL